MENVTGRPGNDGTLWNCRRRARLAAVSRSEWPVISTVDLIAGIVLIAAAVVVLPAMQPRIYAVMLAVAALIAVVVAVNVTYSRNAKPATPVAHSAT